MFQRFQNAKLQETDFIQDSNSRSSSPSLDSRPAFPCNMPSQEIIVSYPTVSSPVITQNAQMTQDQFNNKYASTPPEAHKYVVEMYRPSDVEINRYEDTNRLPNDVFRSQESQRVYQNSVRLEDQLINFRVKSEDVYQPVDLQRVPEYIENVNGTRVDDITRFSNDIIRENDIRNQEININGFGDSHTIDYRIVTDPRPSSESPQSLNESMMRTAETQRLVQETLRIEQRPTTEIRYVSAESLRAVASVENIRAIAQRYDIDIDAHNILPDNIRIGAETPHSLPENLRVTPDATNMVPENLCLSDPQHMIAENLSDTINDLSPEADGRIITHTVALDSPLHLHHYDNNNINDQGNYREVMRIQSPQFVDSYRTNIYNGNIQAPPTPAPSVPPMSDTPTRFYSSESFVASPHTQVVYTNQYNNYDDRTYRQNMTIEESIERGYRDIKPFDQDYPLPISVMHLHESLPPPSIPKLPKPKKPKEPKPCRTPVVHKCIECDRNFKNSTQLKNHMWRHTGEKPFTCEECGSKFTQQGNLRAHRRIHTGEKPYKCHDCNSCFTQLSTLKTHQKIHSDERPYKCVLCEAAFRQIANLKTHQVTHTGDRPHKCELCDKAFTQKSNLKAHKNRVHTENSVARRRRKAPSTIKPHTCDVCNSQFTMISNLRSHMKLHALPKQNSFQCDMCDSTFSQRANLKNHIQRVHRKDGGPVRIRRIKCDECHAVFKVKRLLKSHKMNCHRSNGIGIKFDSVSGDEGSGEEDCSGEEGGSKHKTEGIKNEPDNNDIESHFNYPTESILINEVTPSLLALKTEDSKELSDVEQNLLNKDLSNCSDSLESNLSSYSCQLADSPVKCEPLSTESMLSPAHSSQDLPFISAESN